MAVANRISNLYLQNEFADVFFVFQSEDNTEIPGHKVVIGTVSQNLKELLDDVDDDGRLRIDKTTSRTFEYVLRYIYQDKISLDQIELYTIMDIYQLAERFQIMILKSICRSSIEKILLGSINYIEVYRHVRNINLTFAYDLVLRRIASDFQKVIQLKEFLSLTSEELSIFLKKDDELEIEELDLFNALNIWTTKRCRVEGKQTDGNNKREILGELIYHARIPLIPLQDFSDQILCTGILTPEEQLMIYKYHTGVLTFDASVLGFSTKKRTCMKHVSLKRSKHDRRKYRS